MSFPEFNHFSSLLMYIIKIQGTSKISDYIQIRDNEFTLIAYFKAGRPGKALEECDLTSTKDELINIIENLDYGVIKEIR